MPDTSNGDAYVAAVRGEANVTLECVAFFDDTQFTTSWYIQRQSLDSEVQQIQLTDGVPSSPDGLVDLTLTGNRLTNLTITNFTNQFDMSIIQCGFSDDRRTFHLGFPCMLYNIPLLYNHPLVTLQCSQY